MTSMQNLISRNTSLYNNPEKNKLPTGYPSRDSKGKGNNPLTDYPPNYLINENNEQFNKEHKNEKQKKE